MFHINEGKEERVKKGEKRRKGLDDGSRWLPQAAVGELWEPAHVSSAFTRQSRAGQMQTGHRGRKRSLPRSEILLIPELLPFFKPNHVLI